jgi:myo-inositol-1-phosphate synthase
MKTLVAPAFKARMLGISGRFSTNTLGNRDGEMLEDPGSLKSKAETKLSMLQEILHPKLYPVSVCITAFASTTIRRAETSRRVGTTSTFSDGWAIRCRSRLTSCAGTRLWLRRWCSTLFCSSIWRSARPMRSIQEWLSFYFKASMTAPGLYPEHDIFIQLMKLKNTLRWMRGEDLITHLGLEYDN